MALRARRRQGGGSTGTGSFDPRRPNVATGTGSTNAPRGPGVKGPLGTPAPKGAGLRPVTSPGASYAKVKLPPPPSMPTRTVGSEGMRNQANTNWALAQGQNRDAIYRAIMNLGDTSQFSRYQADPMFAGYQFTQDPNSVWATLARQEAQGLNDIDVNSNAGNTYFSGLRLRDRGKLTDETGRQRLGASTSFSDDLKEFARILGLSESDYRRTLSDADQMDIDAALERDRIAREAYDADVAAAQAEGPVKGAGSVPLGAPAGPSSAQRQFEAQRFASRQAEQQAAEAAKRARRKKGR